MSECVCACCGCVCVCESECVCACCVCVCVNTSVVAHTTTALQGPSMKPQYSTLGLKCAAHVVRSTSTFSFLVHLMAGRLSVFRLCICVSSLLHSVYTCKETLQTMAEDIWTLLPYA